MNITVEYKTKTPIYNYRKEECKNTTAKFSKIFVIKIFVIQYVSGV